MGPMPWEIAAARRKQPGDPSQTPLTIDGPPRLPAPQTPAEQTIQGNQAVASGLDPATKAASLEHIRLENAAAAAKATEGKLTTSALDMAARQFIQSGSIPSFGMGGAAQKTAIINRAAEIAGVNGQTPEQMQVGFARYRNRAAALGQQEKTVSGLRGNEQGALANIQQYIQEADQLPLQTGSPAINSLIQFGQRHIWSDPTLGRMDTAMTNAGGEIGKVISGTPQGGGTLSDSQRQEAIRLLQGTAPIETKRAIAEQLRIDMENRINGQMNVINQGYATLGGNNQPGMVAGGLPGAPGGPPGSTPPPGANLSVPGSGPQGGPQGGGGPPIMDPSGTQASLANGTQTVSDPKLHGLNDRVNQMLKMGASIGQIGKTMTDAGIPINEVLQSLNAAAKFRKEHPEYRGDWHVDLESRQVPMTGVKGVLNDAVNSGPGAAVGSYLNDVTGSHLDNIANAAGGDGQLVNVGLDTLRAEHPYASVAGDIGAGASLYGLGRKIGGRLIGEAAARLPSWVSGPTAKILSSPITGDASLGGYMGSGANGTDAFDPNQALSGAALSAGGGVGLRGVARLGVGAASPTSGRIPLLDQQGVVSSVGQRSGGLLNAFEKMNQAIPFFGAPIRNTRNAAIDQAQRGAFNTALADIKMPDNSVVRLPPTVLKGPAAHAFMQQAFDKAYTQARAGMQFVVDKPYLDDLQQFQAQLGDGTLTDGQAAQVGQRIQSAVGSRLRTGQLSGDSYSNAVNDLTRTARLWAKNPATTAQADALHDYIGIMDDAAARVSDPAAVAQLNAARSGYAKAVVIENASRMNTGGEFTGKQLDIAAKNSSPSVRSRTYLRGDAPMQDYASQMSMLGNPIDASPEAKWVAGGAAGVGAISHPVLAIPSGLNMAANLPGIRDIMNTGLLPNSSSFAPVRAYINGRKRTAGSLFGASLAASQLGNQ